ncbi:MAG: nitroreductase family protein [Acidimicrobiales bacterium]|nr:nitroreductase family protein [Acidimicrobiales bacterium]
MGLNLSAEELLTTTRSVRKRLDFDRPVDRSIVVECIDLALQAPSGSNSQGWQWVVVEDQAKKDAICALYASNYFAYSKGPRPEYGEGDVRRESMPKVVDSATYLAENFSKAPFLVIPCIAGRMGEGVPSAAQAGTWGSILPAVWSFMLALRSQGLGSAWTTLHLPSEAEAAEIIGIPYDDYTQAGLFPVAYTKGTDFKPAKRLPAKDLIHWDTW